MVLLIVNDIVIEAQTMAKDIDWARFGISQVFTAFNAQNARDIIQTQPVDILLSDIEMPDENGLSLIRWINENHYDINCILLTCHADFEYAREGLFLGCQDYITLPAKYEDIGASVLKVVKRRMQHLDEKQLQSYGQSWLASQSKQSEHSKDASTHYTPEEIAQKCINYIIEHISDSNLSVTHIANDIYLNPIYLNRVFKKVKGMNLSQWITKERMTLASRLLTTTDKTAVEIAEQVGYNNYPYFSTVFKKYFGMTPSQYPKNSN